MCRERPEDPQTPLKMHDKERKRAKSTIVSKTPLLRAKMSSNLIFQKRRIFVSFSQIGGNLNHYLTHLSGLKKIILTNCRVSKIEWILLWKVRIVLYFFTASSYYFSPNIINYTRKVIQSVSRVVFYQCIFAHYFHFYINGLSSVTRTKIFQAVDPG